MHPWAALAAIAGGLAWIPVRAAISVTFSQPLLGLSYEDWNRVGVIPIGLMLMALLGGLGPRLRGSFARAGWGVAAIGLVGMLIGVTMEFWFAGGLAGDRELAMVGWLVYLLPGIAVHVVGMLIVGVGLLRGGASDVRLASLVVGIGLLHALWIPAWFGPDLLLLVDQALIGLAWVGIGVVLWRSPEVASVGARMGADVRDR